MILHDNNIAKEILTTRGVNSCVFLPADGNQTFKKRLWTNNHIGLYDFDVIESKSDLLCKIMDLDGINILWQSSNDAMAKYHLWNLTCCTAEEILQTGAMIGSDCKHVTYGYRQKRWILRISPKWKEGRIYKDAPKLLHTWCNDSTRQQSLPHFNLFKALTGKTICEEKNYKWVGKSAQTETYMTITEKMKAILND